MAPDTITAAADFLARHGRVLDRRRLLHVLGADTAEGVLTALDAYRRDDGGYGWGLESDLRSPESQPVAAMHAFEVFADLAPFRTQRAAELCDWCAEHSVDGAALTFALPITDPAGCAPWFREPDTTSPSLHMTGAVLAQALRVAQHDPAVAEHPWLTAATEWSLEQIGALGDPTSHELLFSLQVLDAEADRRPDAMALLERLAALVPPDGIVPVTGGIEGEVFHPLELSRFPDRPVRERFEPKVIAADLDRLAAEQQDDGGWDVNFNSASPIGALEWRAYATVNAVITLRANGRL